MCLFFNRQISKRNGFSIIEVLLAIGILVFVLGVVGATTFNFFKGLTQVSAKTEAKDFIATLTRYLQSQQGCQNSLVSLSAPGATETNLTLAGYGGYGSQTADLTAGYQVSPRLVIESLTIKDKGSPPSLSVKNGKRFQRSVAQIKVVMRTSASSGNLPIRDYYIEVPVLQGIAPMSGTIDGCSVEMSLEEACVVSGGTFTPPSTCTPSVACEFKGTAFGCWPEATCPNANYPAATKYVFSSAGDAVSPPSSMCPSGGVPTSSGTVSYTYLGSPCNKYGVCTTYSNQAFFYICLKCD